MIVEVQVDDSVVEVRQLDRELDERLEQRVLLEGDAERADREILIRHVGLEVQNCGCFAADPASADEPLLKVEPLGHPVDHGIEVEDLDVAEIGALPVIAEVEGSGVDSRRLRLGIGQAEHDVLRRQHDTGRSDLAVGQVEIAGSLEVEPGVGVDGDSRSEVELRGGPGRIRFEALGRGRRQPSAASAGGPRDRSGARYRSRAG